MLRKKKYFQKRIIFEKMTKRPEISWEILFRKEKAREAAADILSAAASQAFFLKLKSCIRFFMPVPDRILPVPRQ